jgi:hypothetical protein
MQCAASRGTQPRCKKHSKVKKQATPGIFDALQVPDAMFR